MAKNRRVPSPTSSGIPQAFDSYGALLDSTEIDAVYIPLPNNLHREWTIRAAEAGKHILCEKPLALTAAECREMIAAADANNVYLMEAFMYRFHPRITEVMDLIAQDAIGRPHVTQAAFTFRLNRPDNIRFQPELGGGALMDVGCYCVNVAATSPARNRKRYRPTQRGMRPAWTVACPARCTLATT